MSNYLKIVNFCRNSILVLSIFFIFFFQFFGKDKFNLYIVSIFIECILILVLNLFSFTFLHYSKKKLNPKGLIASQILVVIVAYLIIDILIMKIFTNQYFLISEYFIKQFIQ